MSSLINNRISLLICDMAGTVIKENGLIYKTIAHTLDDLGYPVTNEDTYYWPGKDKYHIMKKHIQQYEFDANESYINGVYNEANSLLIKNLEETYFDNDSINLIDPNLPKFFDKLKLNNIQIALNTGYPKELQHKIINHFDLDKHIDHFISSEEVTYGRPYPYMIHRLMEKAKIDNVNTVAKIGDTIEDMKEGKNAGCGLVIGVLSGEHKTERLQKYGANIVINNIMDLDKEQLTCDFFL